MKVRQYSNKRAELYLYAQDTILTLQNPTLSRTSEGRRVTLGGILGIQQAQIRSLNRFYEPHQITRMHYLALAS